jgi:hypothetical protein
MAACAAAALAGCSSTDGTAPADGGGTAGNGAGSASSNLASGLAPGLPRTPETSANGGGRQDAAPIMMQDTRDAQDMRQDRRQDMRPAMDQDMGQAMDQPTGQDPRHDLRSPPGAMADSTGDASLQGVGARGVAQSVDRVSRPQALGVGGSVAGAAVGGAVGSRADKASSGDMVYRIIVRFDDGTTRSMMQDSAAGIQGGDRVRVDSKGMLMRE